MDKRYSNDELALLFKRLFETEDGQEVMRILETRFSDPSIVPNASVDGVALAHFTFMRAGEVNVIKYISNQISKKVGQNDGTEYNRD